MASEEKPSVYLETSVISYITSRPSRDLRIAALQQASQEWWERRRTDFRLMISDLVLNEISSGDSQESIKRFELVKSLEALPETKEIRGIAREFIKRGFLPLKATEDAIHITCAAVNGIDYLLTWNCKHIANVEIERKIVKVLATLGYEAPWICTPLEMMGVKDYD